MLRLPTIRFRAIEPGTLQPGCRSINRDLLRAFCVALFCCWAQHPGLVAKCESVFELTPDFRAARRLPAFYVHGIDADGILILGSSKTSPEALVEARFIVSKMLSGNPNLRTALVEAGVRITVMSASELTTDVPEHSQLTPKRYWDRRARGLGGTVENPVVSCGEENLLEYPGDPYHGEDILIHELSHTVHLVGMAKVDPGFDARLRRTFEQAVQNKLWEGTYAATNYEEYFAEGSQSWFGCNAPPGKVHGEIRTRDALRAYDPPLASLLREVYGDNPWQYAPRSARLSRDKRPAPSLGEGRQFKWPKHLDQVDETSARK